MSQLLINDLQALIDFSRILKIINKAVFNDQSGNPQETDDENDTAGCQYRFSVGSGEFC